MTRDWVDFKEIKEAVSIQMVLDHYGIKGFRRNGDELRGACPIHKGSARSKNFAVNVSKNAFKCFSRECGASGNVLDFVAAMERCSVREAALKLNEWFKIGESESELAQQQDEDTNEADKIKRGIYRDKEGALFELVTVATSAEDFERLVVYRELFANYQFWVAPPQSFSPGENAEESCFTLVKEL